MRQQKFAECVDRRRALRRHATHLAESAVIRQIAINAKPEITVRSDNEQVDKVGGFAQAQRKFGEDARWRDATNLVDIAIRRTPCVADIGKPEISICAYSD